MELYDAISRRRSVRQYTHTPLSEQQHTFVQQSIEQTKQLHQAESVRIHNVLDGETVQNTMLGLVGAYGKVRSPHYLIASAKPTGRYLENVGYVLEQVVLALTTAGIGTCWIGAHLSKQPVRDVIQLPAGHVPVLLIAYGIPANPETVWRKQVSEFKRKQLDAMLLSPIVGAWSNCLEAARLAPSAVNSQPWRFAIENDTIMHVYQAKGGILAGKLLHAVNRVDMGIALCHIQVAAEHNQQSVSFQSRPVQEFAGCSYCTSVILRPGS